INTFSDVLANFSGFLLDFFLNKAPSSSLLEANTRNVLSFKRYPLPSSHIFLVEYLPVFSFNTFCLEKVQFFQAPSSYADVTLTIFWKSLSSLQLLIVSSTGIPFTKCSLIALFTTGKS